MDNDCVGADNRPVPDLDVAENLGPGGDIDIIANARHFEFLASPSDDGEWPHKDVFTYLGAAMDDNADTVVSHLKSWADFGGIRQIAMEEQNAKSRDNPG